MDIVNEAIKTRGKPKKIGRRQLGIQDEDDSA